MKRFFNRNKEEINKLVDEYKTLISEDHYDMWGYCFNQNVINKQIEIFKELHNREKLILLLYKTEEDFGIINAIKRGSLKKIEKFRLYSQTKLFFEDCKYHDRTHPFFPLVVGSSFDDLNPDLNFNYIANLIIGYTCLIKLIY